MTSKESSMSTISAPQVEEAGPADATHPGGEEAAAVGTTSALQEIVAADTEKEERREGKEKAVADTSSLEGDAYVVPSSSTPQAEGKSQAEEEAEVKAENEWYKALYEEDSKRLLELLKERPGLELWKRGWEEEPDWLVEGRPRNYWKEEKKSAWMGRTALHVGARRGNVKLLEHVLLLCKEETGRQWSIMENLFTAVDGEYKLDAIAIAIVNGKNDVVATLLEAGCHHPPVEKLYCIEKQKHKKDGGLWWEYQRQMRESPKEHMQEVEELRKITREIKETFQVDPQFQAAVLDRYELHRDYNFYPLEEYPEYLFHFLFTRFEAVEDDSLDFYLGSKINVLILTEIAERARESKSYGLLESMWTMKDGQGRPPFHVAADEERSESVLLEKKMIMIRESFWLSSYAREYNLYANTSWFGIEALDGAGRTAVHRQFVRGDKMPLNILLRNSESGHDQELYDRSHISGNGPLAELAKSKSSSRAKGPDCFDERQMEYVDEAFRECLEEKEFSVEKRSLWVVTRTGDDYYIDLRHLSERNGFYGQFFPKCRPIVSALLHHYDLNDDLLQLSDFLPTGFRRALSGYDAQHPAFLNNIYLSDAESHLPSSGPINVVVQMVRLQFWYKIAHIYVTYGDKSKIFMAAAMGNYNMLQNCIDAGYDTLQEDIDGSTLLHYAIKGIDNQMNKLPSGLHLCSFVDCEHIVKDSEEQRKRWETKLKSFIIFEKTQVDKVLVERQACISLLIQQGCDIFKANKRGEVPQLHRNANPKLLKWWYEKQLKEFRTAQREYSLATNAISVIAALVATASYVGPLQPPLGYDDNPTQLRLDITAVKVFIVCDTLSFYFAIAAIIYALVPYLPLHSQQSITDNLRHTKKLVMISVGLLFPSIICILVAFAAGSMAIIQTNQTRWNHGGLIIGTTSFGGIACLAAILIFLTRLLARKSRLSKILHEKLVFSFLVSFY